MSDKMESIYDVSTFLYICDECGAVYPMYMSPNWYDTIGHCEGSLCKTCFEKLCPNPEYDSLETYIAKYIENCGCDMEMALYMRDTILNSALIDVWDSELGESILSQCTHDNATIK